MTEIDLIDLDIRLLEVRPASEDPGQVRLPKREVGRYVVRYYEHSRSELVLFVQEYTQATPLADIPEPSPTDPSVDEPTASTRPRCPLCSSEKERARVHGGIGTEPGRVPGMLPQMTPPDWWRLLAVVLAIAGVAQVIIGVIGAWMCVAATQARCRYTTPCQPHPWFGMAVLGFVLGVACLGGAVVAWQPDPDEPTP